MNDPPPILPTPLVGDGEPVPCVDGVARPYLNLDAAASTSALPAVAQRVAEFLPGYSSVHRGAGYRPPGDRRVRAGASSGVGLRRARRRRR